MQPFIQLNGPIVEQEVKGWYILVMYNMYHLLFFKTFYDLGLDKILSGRFDNCRNARFSTKVGNNQYLRKCATCGLTKNL
ncbi:hypothetical protein F8155_15255 [Priestia endophytica]|nr:hypothetical protein F8155_15255 [Priestia endophytica]